MSTRSKMVRTGVLILTVLFASNLALAEETSSHFSLSTFLGQVLNFVVLFGGLAYVLRKPVKDYLQKKSEEIALLLQQSEKLKNESIQKLEQTRDRLARLEDEIKRMKKEAEEEALRERDRIKSEAQQEAERLRKLAREEIDSLVRTSVLELKSYVFQLSMVRAEERIKEKMNPDLHRKIIHRAIDDLRAVYESAINN